MPYASINEVYGDNFGKTKRNEKREVRENNYSTITENITKYNEPQPDSSFGSKLEDFYGDMSQNKLVEDDGDDFEYLYEDDSDDESDFEIDEDEEKTERFTGAAKNSCSKMLFHLSKCSKCRKYVMEKFQIEKQEVSIAKKSTRDELLDIAIYIITGIFILFLLDIIVRLGKNLR